jgi:hypothetical protein
MYMKMAMYAVPFLAHSPLPVKPKELKSAFPLPEAKLVLPPIKAAVIHLSA